MQRLYRRCLWLILLWCLPVLLNSQSLPTGSFDALSDLFQDRDSISLFADSATAHRVLLHDSLSELPVNEILNHLNNQLGINSIRYNPGVIILFSSWVENQLPVAAIVPDSRLYRVGGRLVDSRSGRPIANGTVIVNEMEVGATTDSSGFYQMELPPGRYSVKAIGPGTLASNLDLLVDGEVNLDIELFEKTVELAEIVISDVNPEVNLLNLQPGSLTMEITELKQIPAFLGEVDISRAVISLPGVTSVGEGATGFNVRGGTIDQNLVLMDGMPLFNSSHMLGFFSAFNPDLVGDFTLYKGLIPSHLGGRVSSVLQVDQKGPNKSELDASVSLGPVNSKLLLDIPLKKNVSGLVVGGRAAYPNYILSSFPDESIVSGSRANYYDTTFKYDHEFEAGTSLTTSLYASEDQFNLSEDTTFNYSSILAGIAYQKVLPNQWTFKLQSSWSRYRAGIEDQTLNQQSEFSNGISQVSLKSMVVADNQKTDYQFGLEANFYQFFTGELVPLGQESEVSPQTLPDRKAMDFSVFFGLQQSISDAIGFQAGLRATSFFNLGYDEFPVFSPENQRDPVFVTDTLVLEDGDFEQLNISLEPRLALNVRLTPSASVKAGYSRTFQYIHLFSNTVASLPTDLWRPSDPNLAPLSAHLFSVGLFKNLQENLFETSIEVFYKDIENTVDFLNGTRVLLNPELVFQTLQGESEAYGLELSVHKTRGKFTGRLGYTYSRSWSRFQSDIEDQNLNQGERFPANFDRPHDLNLFGNWKLGRLWNVSANFAYTSGRPVSLPEQSFRFGGAIVFSAINRNNFRVPDFHRLDFAVTLEGSNKRNRNFNTSWTFSVYNVYGRKNVFSVFINGEDGRPRQLSVLGAPFPSLTFNLKLN